jgi:hypothetical protein
MGLFKIEDLFFFKSNNLEDLRQRIRAEMQQISPDILSAVYKVLVNAKWLAWDNFNICVKFYC